MAQVLADSERMFGTLARQRYAALFVAAIRDVASDPNRLGSCREEGLSGDLRTYHVGHSGRQIPANMGRVKSPRHALVYSVGSDGVVDVLGIVHERMDRPDVLRRIATLQGQE